MTEQSYYEGIGRRKRATARVRIYPGGDGTFIVNDRPLQEYFPRLGDIDNLMAPLRVTEQEGRFNVSVHVKGGGITGQTGAVGHGLAKSLASSELARRRPTPSARFHWVLPMVAWVLLRQAPSAGACTL
jgi:small subunit ribosomal protein S9